MSRAPEVSVLLPVRDGAATIGAALRSLQEQTFEAFECVVVDDGSSDGTREIVCDLAREDPRFRYVPQPPSGIAAALNRAAVEARGTQLARQDADDESLPSRLAAQVERLRSRPELGLVATQVEHTGLPLTDGGRRYADWLAGVRSVRDIANALWIESPLPHPTVVLRRAVLERAGGYRSLGWPEDYDLWLRMRRLGVPMEKLDRVLYRWCDSPERASRRLPDYAADRFLACRVHHLARFLEHRSTVIWGAGRDGRRFARALLREAVGIEAFLDIDPRKIGRRAYERPILEARAWLSAQEPRSPAPGALGGHADAESIPRLRRDGPIVLAAVGSRGAREEIRRVLRSYGWVEGVDFLCVA